MVSFFCQVIATGTAGDLGEHAREHVEMEPKLEPEENVLSIAVEQPALAPQPRAGRVTRNAVQFTALGAVGAAGDHAQEPVEMALSHAQEGILPLYLVEEAIAVAFLPNLEVAICNAVR